MPQAAYCYMRVVGRGSYGEVTLVKHRRDGKQVGDLGPGQGRIGKGYGYVEGVLNSTRPGLVGRDSPRIRGQLPNFPYNRSPKLCLFFRIN